jgi:hypothetical protein
MLYFDVVRLYRRLSCGCSKATIWNHWELDSRVSLTGLFDNGLSTIGVAWVAGIRTTIARFIAGVVSATREYPVVEKTGTTGNLMCVYALEPHSIQFSG